MKECATCTKEIPDGCKYCKDHNPIDWSNDALDEEIFECERTMICRFTEKQFEDCDKLIAY